MARRLKVWTEEEAVLRTEQRCHPVRPAGIQGPLSWLWRKAHAAGVASVEGDLEALRRARERENTRQLPLTDMERMVSDAARAAELFGEDELEAFAAALQKDRKR